MNQIKSIGRLCASVALGLCLCACTVLPNGANDGPVTAVSGSKSMQSVNNNKRLQGNVAQESTAWRLGALEGLCSVQIDGGAHPALVVDDVLLSTDALFDTAIAALSDSGLVVMEQLAARLAHYKDIKRVELVGHADERGSASKNYKLAQGRAEAVRQWLDNNLPEALPMRVLSMGESKSHKRKHVVELATDRRVDVRIIAADVNAGNIDSTLCSLPSQETMVLPGSALTLSVPKPIQNRNRLEPYNGDLPLSPGDQVRIAVAGDEDLSGVFEVSLGGGIDIPLLGRQMVVGLTIPAIQTILEDELVDQELIQRYAVNVDAHVVEWSAVDVYIRGAVFNKGRVTINITTPEYLELNDKRQGGDDGQGRLLSFALTQAGGVRPDADLSNIQILRNGETIHVDLSGLVHGELARDLPLVAGDEVIIPSTGRFDVALAAPTQVTPPGIRVFMSNATAPVYSNSLAHITKDEASLPYGSRILQALTTMNCIGGSQSVNAARRTVLVTTDRITGEIAVTERSVQRLLSEPNRMDINPYLMPGDAIACFDADLSNLREIAKLFSDLFSPLVAMSAIFGRF